VDIPQVMVDQRVNQILHDFSHRLPQGVGLGDYLRSSGQTLEAVQKDLAPDAEMAVRRELVVEAVAEAEGLEATDEEVEERVRTDAEAADRDPEALLENLRRTGGFETLREDMVIQKAMRFLVDSATPIPTSLAEARESLWTPSSDVAPAAGGGKLWTPGDPEPGRRA
jgi:trigger factor